VYLSIKNISCVLFHSKSHMKSMSVTVPLMLLVGIVKLALLH